MVLAAAKCDKIFAELARKYNLHLHQGAARKCSYDFSPESQLRKDDTDEVEKFHANIVQLTMDLAQ